MLALWKDVPSLFTEDLELKFEQINQVVTFHRNYYKQSVHIKNYKKKEG